MPITLKQSLISYKDNEGVYHGINTLGETATINQLTSIRNEASRQIGNIQQAGDAARDSVPLEYTTLSDKVDNLESSIAPLYSELTLPADAGTYCTYNGVLYRANTTIASGETWTSSHWTKVNVGGEIGDLKSALNDEVADIKEAIYNISETESPETDWRIGYFQRSSGEVRTSTTTQICTIDAGIPSDVTHIIADSGYQFRVFGWGNSGYLGTWRQGVFQTSNAGTPYDYLDLRPLKSAGATIIKLVVTRTDEQDITVSEGENITYRVENSKIDEVDNKFIRYDAAQTLTDAQKQQARDNIGASTGAVLYSEPQTLTDEQKNTARGNIGAVTVGDITDAVNQLQMSGLIHETLPAKSFAQGMYNSSGNISGGQGSSNIRTWDYLPSNVVSVSVANGYTMSIHMWDTSKDPVEHVGFIKNSSNGMNLSDETIISGYPATYKFKVVLYPPIGVDVYWYADYDKISLGYATDKKLITDGVAADAKTVGDLLEVEYTKISTTADDWTKGSINISNGGNTSPSTRIRTIAPDGVSSARVINGANMVFLAFCWAGDTYQGRWLGSEFTTLSGSSLGYFSELDFAPIYKTGSTKVVIVAMVGTDNTQGIATTDGANIEFVKCESVIDSHNADLTELRNDQDFNMAWSCLHAYDFQKGSYNTTTGEHRVDASTTLMRTKDYLPENVGGVKAAQGYKIAVFAYDTSIVIPDPNPDNIRQFIGTITLTGIRKNAGDDIWRTDYVDLRQYPAPYKFKVVLTRANSDDTDETNNTTVSIPVDYVNVLVYTQKIGIPVHSPYDHGPYDIYKERFADWYSGQQTSYTAEGFGENTTYAQVIAAFDGLVTLDPVYVSKVKLGTTSGTASRAGFDYDGEPYSYDIWEYVFKPKKYGIDLSPKKVPKIYMDGSMHGFEKCGTYGVYYFLKDLITKWDTVPVLASIRQSVEIHVIPVSNPWGFTHNTYQNGQGVNINRNFSFNGEWTVNPAWEQNASGNAPFDQTESQIIRDWLIAAEPDLLLYANLHTYGRYETSNYTNINVCLPIGDSNDDYYDRFLRVLVNHINEQTLRWPIMYPAIQPGPDIMLGFIQAHQEASDSSIRGQAAWWASAMRKIVALTLEGINGLKDAGVTIIPSFTGDVYKIDSENIGNLIIQTLREYGD